MEHHSRGLRRHLIKQGTAADQVDSLIEQIRKDYTAARLPEVDRAILDYAVKLTRQPSDIDSSDVESLRNSGLDDRGIHDLCAIVAYFAFANRIANGLGIELEE